MSTSGVLIVIPARYKSSRYPGKPLAELRGASGVAKSLIRRTWEAAQEVSGAHRVVVATDDARIRAAAEAFGAEVVMTAESCANGTERCADVLARRPDLTPEVVVNLQGDSPLTPPWFVESLIEAMLAAPGLQVATPVLRCDKETLEAFLEDRRAGRVGGTTAVFGATRDALYFSKEVVPYTGRAFAEGEAIPVFHHVGLYAYRPAALAAYGRAAPGPLENFEGLEQLRFLEQGTPIRCVEVESRGRVFWELNNPVDVPRIESALARMGLG